MLSRAATLFCLLLSTVFATAQSTPLTAAAASSSPTAADFNAVQGRVLSPDGQPASGIRVELDQATTAVPITATYTQKDGTFELYNIPKGDYELVADSDDSEVSDTVKLQGPPPSLELRFPRDPRQPDDASPLISVTQMLVPEKARLIYGKAVARFHAGKIDEAQTLVAQALMIEPQFPEALTLQGVLYLAKPDLESAQRSFAQAVLIDPRNGPALIALSAIYNHEGRFDEAYSASERALSVTPHAWQGYMEMAKASIAKKMYHRALQLVRQSERLGGNSMAEVHLVKAYALVPLKLYKSARYELQACLTRQAKGQVADQARSMLAEVTTLEQGEILAATR